MHADLKPTSAELPSYAGAVSESYGCAAGNACLTDKNSPVGEIRGRIMIVTP